MRQVLKANGYCSVLMKGLVLQILLCERDSSYKP